MTDPDPIWSYLAKHQDQEDNAPGLRTCMGGGAVGRPPASTSALREQQARPGTIRPTSQRVDERTIKWTAGELI